MINAADLVKLIDTDVDVCNLQLPDHPDHIVDMSAQISPKKTMSVREILETIQSFDEVIEARSLLMKRLDDHVRLSTGMLPDADTLMYANKRICLMSYLQTPDFCCVNWVTDINEEFVVESFDMDCRTVVIRAIKDGEDRFVVPYDMFVDGTFSACPIPTEEIPFI